MSYVCRFCMKLPGDGAIETVRYIKENVRCYDPCMIALLETRVTSCYAKHSIMKKTKFN